MEITRVVIRNFRCIKHVEIALDPTTVFIGANNVGKTAILDAIRIALTRRWGQRGTGFTETDIHLPPGTTDPKEAAPINIQIEFEEKVADEWGEDVHNELTDVIQLDPRTGRGIIMLKVVCGMTGLEGALEPRWEFLNIERQPLTGRGARSVNLQEVFQYLPVFYLKPTRNAEEEFSTRSQFWGRLLKAMNVPDALRAEIKTNLDSLNQQLLTADPRLDTVATDLKNLSKVAPTDTPGDLELRALALQPWDMLQKAEVIYKSQGDQPWLPLASHGHGVQSLAVIFLFDAYVKLLLGESYRANSTAVLELEEPEAHLHPQATKSLCAPILGLSGQKLITTHSPYFLQSVPFRNLRLLRMTTEGTKVTWLPPSFSAPVPHIPELDELVSGSKPLLTYERATELLTVNGVLSEELYRKLLKLYAKHADRKTVIGSLKQLRQASKLHVSNDELDKLETWARRIRGEIFFARKWLLVEGQSDYLIMGSLAAAMGYPVSERGVSIIDAKNNGDVGTFAALARALGIPWIALFDGDAAGLGYVEQIRKREFEADEIERRCFTIPHTDVEAILVAGGLEAELRAILGVLGVPDADHMTSAQVIEALRGRKVEYAMELSRQLETNGEILTKVPAILTQAIQQLQVVTE